ncbi:hypothetical protein V6N12_044955 [Hibiscus sabdariffa]|uniref:Reverse transcriptase zinc-binding domain-containing protein n=1 Tax=Hibiscus sabdariffa TaxID=183260 RepID=A0ABR2G1D1_9ROSI
MSWVSGNGIFLNVVLPVDMLLWIATVKAPSGMNLSDTPCWSHMPNGNIQVRSAYRSQLGVQSGPLEPIWKTIQAFKGLPHIKLFLWLLCHEKLLSNEERCHRHIALDARCSICGAEKEMLDHIFKRCPTAFILWSSLI